MQTPQDRNEADVVQFRHLLRSFEQLEDTTRTRLIGSKKKEFTHFFACFSRADRSEMMKLRQYAPSFNLFTILGIAYAEDRVHTPFMANLLDPNASHGQEFLFMDNFLFFLFSDSKTGRIANVNVYREYSTFDGVIDILVKMEVDQKPWVIVIENKIYAPDQPMQLERYYNVVRKLFAGDTNCLIVYLTPDGRKPSPISISAKLLNAQMATGNFRCMSYRTDIRGWLEKSLTEIQAPTVKETVRQYLGIVKNL